MIKSSRVALRAGIGRGNEEGAGAAGIVASALSDGAVTEVTWAGTAAPWDDADAAGAAPPSAPAAAAIALACCAAPGSFDAWCPIEHGRVKATNENNLKRQGR